VSLQFLHHLFAEHFGWCFPSQAFARRVVELVADLLDVVVCHASDVPLAGKPVSGEVISVFDGSLLPRIA